MTMTTKTPTSTPTSTDDAIRPSFSSRVGTFAGASGHTGGLIGLALVVLVVFTLLSPRIYPSALNLQSIGYAIPEVALLALAVCITMASGGIDLSIVATANLSALISATVSIALVGGGLPGGAAVLIGVLVGLAAGALCGVFNGILVAKLRIAPILATLATMTLFTGIALIVTRGEPVYGLPEEFLALGTATIAVIPVSFWLFVIVVALLWFVMNRTGLGLRVILVGASPEAADYSGIRRSRVLLQTYALSGLIAGVAGLMMSARSASATADYGSSYLLLAITIAVLGGTNPTGGRSPIVGVAVAAVVLQMISSGFNILQISPYIYQIVQGLILVVVLILELRRGRLTRWMRGLVSRPAKDGLLAPTP
jgi:simple sugar transport system permease protein